MSFGTKNPAQYKHHKFPTIIPESFDSCQVCGKPTPKAADGYTPVVACVVPMEEHMGEQFAYLACSTCYKVNDRLHPENLEVLREYRRTLKRGRKPGSQIGAAEVIAANGIGIKWGEPGPKPKKTRQRRASPVTQMTIEDILSVIEDLKAQVLALGATPVVPVVPEEEPESELTDEDIDMGMTDEQRARFDALANKSSPVIYDNDDSYDIEKIAANW